MLRVFHHYFSARKLSFFLIESVAIALAGIIGAVVMVRALSPVSAHPAVGPALPLYAVLSAGFVLTFQFALYLQDLYDLRVAAQDQRQGSRLLKAAGVGAVAMGLLMTVTPLQIPAGALLGAAMGSLAGTLVARAGLRVFVGEPVRVLIVGNGIKAHQLSNLISMEGEDVFQVSGMLAPPRQSWGGADDPIEQAARRVRAPYVVLAADEPLTPQWADSLLRCRVAGLRVYDAAGFCERVLRRIPITHINPSELAFADELSASSARRFFKRVFDVVITLVLLVPSLPVMLLLAIAIKLTSRGPIFYRQERVGAHGETYWLWKFRSMRVDAEKDGAVWAKQNDDRVTKVGRFIRKTRMDELPQVFNVLMGEMSFVGPRPERPVFVEQLKRQIPYYGLREAVKPGITGWAQIRYPYGASVDDSRNKLEFDLYYVKNGSLFLDLAIIFHTVRHVLLGRGAR